MIHFKRFLLFLSQREHFPKESHQTTGLCSGDSRSEASTYSSAKHYAKKYLAACCAGILLVCFPLSASSVPQKITFIHTNDMHSHLLGTPISINHIQTATGNNMNLGGWARIASLIRKTKAERDNPVVVVDAGDFLMGTLFHTLCRERSMELRLMKEMGYDVTTFGNHEFDLKPAGLARIITSAQRMGGMPSIVASNIVFSDKSEEDDTLEEVCKSGLVKPYVVVVRNGLRIGVFGILGKKAAEVSPYAGPVTFREQAAAAREMVDLLRTREKVDFVVCLSHGGVDLKNKERSEDVILAGKVPGIDIIISGHTHTPLRSPVVKGNTIIVQAWCFGRWAGILDVVRENGIVTMSGYRSVEINDSIPADPGVRGIIAGIPDPDPLHFLAPLVVIEQETIAGGTAMKAAKTLHAFIPGPADSLPPRLFHPLGKVRGQCFFVDLGQYLQRPVTVFLPFFFLGRLGIIQ